MLNLSKKIPVGIVGATGMVGQKYLELLQNHIWFEVVLLAASSRSSGKTYHEAVNGRWQMTNPLKSEIANLKVVEIADIINQKIQIKPKIIFSCFEINDKELIKKYEEDFAKIGYAVFSNASANRWQNDIPMLLPEINFNHLDIIKNQQDRLNSKGFIVVKPNCSIQTYLTPIFALQKAGFEIEQLIITTMQAVSGSGYPGVPSLDIIDNLIPFIEGEEQKTEQEPLKILGKIENGKFTNYTGLKISATCNRVAVIDGHSSCVSLKFKNKKPSKEEIVRIWQEFRSLPQELELPFAPIRPIYYTQTQNRPQPRKDRDNDKGMAVTVGRLRECSIFDYKFTSLSHNTVRGAAGGGILNAELALKMGFIEKE
jgi:aspartate-semialdehyde dehydrogenase